MAPLHLIRRRRAGKGRERVLKKAWQERMKELFKLVWIHPSPLVALAQLYAETRPSDNQLLGQCVSKIGYFWHLKFFFLDRFTMSETNGNRKSRRE